MSNKMEILTVKAIPQSIDIVTAFADRIMTEHECSGIIKAKISIVIDEIVSNISSYAYPDGGGELEFSIGVSEGSVIMTFTDMGQPFDPLKNPDPDVSIPTSKKQVGGLGIFMTKKMMDSVAYRYDDGKNILTITKKL